MDDKLKNANIDKESKIIIKHKIIEFENNV